jgi:hypothetical protein
MSEQCLHPSPGFSLSRDKRHHLVAPRRVSAGWLSGRMGSRWISVDGHLRPQQQRYWLGNCEGGRSNNQRWSASTARTGGQSSLQRIQLPDSGRPTTRMHEAIVTSRHLFFAVATTLTGGEACAAKNRAAMPMSAHAAAACPKATSPTAIWADHGSESYDIGISAPRPYRRMSFDSRSDTSVIAPFSLWLNAITQINVIDPRAYAARRVQEATGDVCILATNMGDVRLVMWRSRSILYDGRDTADFNAGGIVTSVGRPTFVVHVFARDSATLLDNLQILGTMRRLQPAR